MKTTFLSCFCAIALAAGAFGQTPTPPPESGAPEASPALGTSPSVATATPAPVATVTPVAAATAAPVVASSPVATPSTSPETEDEFDRAIEKKIRKHLKIGTGDHNGNEDVPWIALPIVFIVFLSIFGVPVAIVGLIMYFSFSKSRALHKTVRMMVEKGQPVPEALLNPPPVVRQRSDLRRGITLLMVGLGLVIFLGAVNDWEGGAWSIGIIPFMIGLGYLLVWRLDVHRADASPKV